MIRCRLKAILAERDIKHGDFAKQLGVNPATLSAWVHNRQKPSMDMAYLIAELLEMNVMEIWVKEEYDETKNNN